jgi:hypothetical protein
MSTTAEKLLEAIRTLPEPLLADVLEFVESLSYQRDVLEIVDPTQPLSKLSGGLELSKTFYLDPLTIQQQLRNEWQRVDN